MNYRLIFNRHYLKWIYAWLILWLQVNCYANGLPQAVSKENVKDCAFIASIEGSSGLTKTGNWQRLAKDAALVQALKLQASHVVWEAIIQVSSENGIATGKAYRCDN